MKKINADKILRGVVLNNIPRILSLLDKNPYSETYGSFDRRYWHYKTIDFSCGMQQELILPLAYVWKTKFKGNSYFQLPRIKNYLEGILQYHQKQSHKDGSLDDYFPYERAYGATAYTLTALTEVALLTKLTSRNVIKSFEKTADFLANYKERGELSNHLAIASMALINLYLLTKKIIWKKSSDQLINKLEEKQHEEGWFPEYEGCDLGYQTVTLEFLARRYQKSPSKKLANMLSKSLTFLVNFVHPDGSLGGEYGSRNTYNFYPGGFAILSSQFPQAAKILGYFFKGLENNTGNYLEDDGVFGHILSSYVVALRSSKIKISQPVFKEYKKPVVRYFPEAGFFIGKSGEMAVFGTTTKGGVYKIFKKDRLVCSDTGFIGELSLGTKFCQNKSKISTGTVGKNIIEIKGNFQKYNSRYLTRIQMIGVRFLSLIFGRFKSFSNFMRLIMQKIIIYHKQPLNIRFKRKIIFNDGGIRIEDEIFNKEKQEIISLYRSTDCVNIHVVTSNSFQVANLLSWEKVKTEAKQNYFRLIKIFRENKQVCFSEARNK